MGSCDIQPTSTHNIGAIQMAAHSWGGIAVQKVRIKTLPGRSWHSLNNNQAVLSVVVDEHRGQCEARLNLSDRVISRPSGRQRPNGHISFIPAQVPVWGYSEDIDQVDEIRLILETAHVKAIMGDEFTPAPMQEPRLVFTDDSLQSLARLAFESEDKAAWSSLFGDGLVAAMISRFLDIDARPVRNPRRLGLPPRQLTAVTDFIRDNLAASIRLAQLSRLADLSPSQFGRAFKISTGTSPHLWHLQARIERAKLLLRDRRKTLAEIALDTGFSEQSHFNRAFRAATGASPGTWRRSLRG
ncbi:MAG TPA: AraC family transcriptional regulator [Rhizomicrobium sp.]|jgi:AraC-like DNA-binding protein|nr:AraC family transcriptional regulator [Rhizomicrobium sp.]